MSFPPCQPAFPEAIRWAKATPYLDPAPWASSQAEQGHGENAFDPMVPSSAVVNPCGHHEMQ